MRAMSRDIKTTKAGRGRGRSGIWTIVAAAGLVALTMALTWPLKAQTAQNGLPGSTPPQGFQALEPDPAFMVHSPPIFGTHYKAYAGSDFQPFFDDTYTNTGVWDALYSLGTGFAFYTTRLDLPQGATLSEVEFYYIDNNASADIFFLFEENHISANAPGPGQFTETSSGASPAIQKVILSFAPFPVNNTQYAYLVGASFGDAGPTLQLLGARVGYRGPAGNLFLLPSPDRFVDTRPATTIGGKVGPFVGISGDFDFFDFTVTGVPGRDGNTIPTGSTGVVGNVTAIGPTATGLFKILPGGTPCTTGTSTVNFNAGVTTANAFNSGLNASGELRACFGSTRGATSHLTIDVVGATQ